jgi:hypothetical protein
MPGALKPTAAQLVADGHDTLLKGAKPTGSVPADQLDPPSVVNNAAATARVPWAPAAPTATQSVLDRHDTPSSSARPNGRVPSDQEDPPSVVNATPTSSRPVTIWLTTTTQSLVDGHDTDPGAP